MIDCKIIKYVSSDGQPSVHSSALELNSIQLMEARETSTVVTLYGGEKVEVQIPFKELKELHDNRPSFYDRPAPKDKLKTYPIVEIGVQKFRLDIRTSNYQEETTNYLIINANFPVKNDALRTAAEYVIGVERFCDSTFNKYEGHISIGQLFDPETVRNELEQKIKEFLEL